MKKRLAMLLIAVQIGFTLSACSVPEQAAGGSSTEAADSADTSETAETPETSEETAEEGDEVDEAAALTVRFETEKPWVNSNIAGTVKDSGYAPDLQDDFYVAVNQEWMQTAEFEPGHSSVSVFSELETERREELLALMTDETLEGEDAEKVRNLYALWMDWDARNAADNIGEIQKHITPIQEISSLEELTEYLTSEECLVYGAGRYLAGFQIGMDNLESQKYNVELCATSLTLEDAAEYAELTDDGARQKEYADAVSSYMLQRIGYSEEEAAELIQQKYALEEKIASHMMTVEEQYDPDAIDRMYNPVTIEELAALSPAYPLAEVLKTGKMAGSKYINLQEPAWLEALNELYTEENVEAIKAWLIDAVAGRYIDIIDEEAYRAYQQFYAKRRGTSEVKPDEEAAYEFVSESLSSSVARMFVQKCMTPEIKQEITDIIADAVSYYREMLAETEWLSAQTKEKAVEKLDNIGIRAVYPDVWEDESGLVIHSAEEGETLLLALVSLQLYYDDYCRSLVNTEVNPTFWLQEDVTEVNSYYYLGSNEIYIIAGILGGEIYRADMSYEEKLGGIGVVIGHELSHAFDTRGSQFDKDGNVSDWWTEEDYATFRERADRLINYMGSMVVDESGKNYNGSLVQTETIADMAGVKCMLGLAAQKEDFDYDAFFRSYAEIWRREETKETVDSRIASDVHALSYLRVNAVVQQFEEFYETYGVKEGDGMYLAPEDRVAVW